MIDYKSLNSPKLEKVKQAHMNSQKLCADLAEQLKTEDSKRKEVELRELLKAERTNCHKLSYAVSNEEDRLFREALAKEYDVQGNPKFSQAYSIAYSNGHSCGYGEVENYFRDLAELIR